MKRLKRIITSKAFLPAVFIFFALQAVVYASFIGFGIPSDENYHFGTIQYYAHQDITTGPFTEGQTIDTLSTVHEIDRNPRYLYPYLLSFPLRVMEGLNFSMYMQVWTFRIISTVFALIGLYVLKRILDEISDDKLVKNFTIFALAMTGMAVWLAGSINYDNLANMLFLLFVWVSVRFIKRPDAVHFMLILLIAAAVSLTKYTFLPTMLVGLALTLLFVWRKNYRPAVFLSQLKKSLRTRKLITITVISGLVLFSGLFIERHVMNLVRYHSIKPSCTEFFSVNECRTYNVFNRNFKQQRDYSAEDKRLLIGDFDPTSFAGEWIYGMYNTLYFQLGDRRFESKTVHRIFAFLLLAAIAIALFLSRKKVRFSRPAWYALVIGGSYVLLLFLFNMNTYISMGKKFAFQGRYLLPVLGLVYFFFILIIVNTYRNRSAHGKKVFGPVWIIILVLFFAIHFPPALLLQNTDASWSETYVLPEETID
ncbi:MAG TPA: hypothetical protein VFX86_03005 [Candidatus Saccharimonadales bacterium]|nr:hypothetical protein [Candidatus Saccharimonadales bacterium]